MIFCIYVIMNRFRKKRLKPKLISLFVPTEDVNPEYKYTYMFLFLKKRPSHFSVTGVNCEFAEDYFELRICHASTYLQQQDGTYGIVSK